MIWGFCRTQVCWVSVYTCVLVYISSTACKQTHHAVCIFYFFFFIFMEFMFVQLWLYVVRVCIYAYACALIYVHERIYAWTHRHAHKWVHMSPKRASPALSLECQRGPSPAGDETTPFSGNPPASDAAAPLHERVTRNRSLDSGQN